MSVGCGLRAAARCGALEHARLAGSTREAADHDQNHDGIIRRQAEDPYAVEVDNMTFAGIPQARVPDAGDQATATVERVPHDPYRRGEGLVLPRTGIITTRSTSRPFPTWVRQDLCGRVIPVTTSGRAIGSPGFAAQPLV